jgi:hypothetical protein
MIEGKVDGYVDGDKKLRFMVFLFFGVWILSLQILDQFSDAKLERVRQIAESHGKLVACTFSNITMWYFLLPATLFFLVSDVYFLWMGAKVLRSGVYPPTGTKVPFRQKVRTGSRAKQIAASYFVGCFMNLTIIAVTLWFSRCTH